MAEKKKRVPSLSHFPALPVSPSSMQQLTSYTTFIFHPKELLFHFTFKEDTFSFLPDILTSQEVARVVGAVCVSAGVFSILQLILLQKGLTRNKSPRSRGSKVRNDFSFWSVLDTFQVKVFHDLSSRFLIPLSFLFHSLLPSFDCVA